MSANAPDRRKSRFYENREAHEEFTPEEREHCRDLLRRLRYLEPHAERIERQGGAKTPSDHFTQREFNALRWVLETDFEFIKEKERAKR